MREHVRLYCRAPSKPADHIELRWYRRTDMAWRIHDHLPYSKALFLPEARLPISIGMKPNSMNTPGERASESEREWTVMRPLGWCLTCPGMFQPCRDTCRTNTRVFRDSRLPEPCEVIRGYPHGKPTGRRSNDQTNREPAGAVLASAPPGSLPSASLTPTVPQATSSFSNPKREAESTIARSTTKTYGER